MKRYMLAVSALLAVCFLLTQSVGAQDASIVSGRDYDVWVSQSFGAPPFPPFHDCARFQGGQMCLDLCGDCGPILFEAPLFGGGFGMTFWGAFVPCNGLNLTFIGTSLDGAGFGAANVMGGFGLGAAELATFGTQGVENPACTVDMPDALSEGENPYSAP